MKESSISDVSINTFTQNLNKKWKDMTKDDIINMNKKDDNEIIIFYLIMN